MTCYSNSCCGIASGHHPLHMALKTSGIKYFAAGLRCEQDWWHRILLKPNNIWSHEFEAGRRSCQPLFTRKNIPRTRFLLSLLCKSRAVRNSACFLGCAVHSAKIGTVVARFCRGCTKISRIGKTQRHVKIANIMNISATPPPLSPPAERILGGSVLHKIPNARSKPVVSISKDIQWLALPQTTDDYAKDIMLPHLDDLGTRRLVGHDDDENADAKPWILRPRMKRVVHPSFLEEEICFSRHAFLPIQREPTEKRSCSSPSSCGGTIIWKPEVIRNHRTFPISFLANNAGR